MIPECTIQVDHLSLSSHCVTIGREDVCNLGLHCIEDGCIEDGLAIATNMIVVGLAIARSRIVDKALSWPVYHILLTTQKGCQNPIYKL